MLITVEVPEQVASSLSANNADRSREILEALLLKQYAEGRISAGWLGKALGMGFHDTEQFLYDCNVRPTITAEEHAKDVEALKQLLA